MASSNSVDMVREGFPVKPDPSRAAMASGNIADIVRSGLSSKYKRGATTTRVFKKGTTNGGLTVYLGKRDFVDHITHVDQIDGVVLIEPDQVKDRKVFGVVKATFKYGREDLDVLGLTFKKDLFFASKQIYPSLTGSPRQPTKLQERLLKKLGSNAYPFNFELSPHLPASVTLQPAPGDTGRPCGIEYELRIFIADSWDIDDKHSKRNVVRLAIRKIMYAPSKQGEQPSIEVSKDYMMSPNKLNMEVSLDKELYYHGETIAVNVHIANNSNRTVKKIKVMVRQFANILMFNQSQYKRTVDVVEQEIGVAPGFTLSKVFWLRPLLANNKEKRSLALDGQIKDEDTNLASSTIITDPAQRENLGIIVQYKVKVKLCMGALGGDLVAHLPFTLMHPKPEPTRSKSREDESTSDNAPESASGEDLIQLDDEADGDIIFEDFARLRLKRETDPA